MISYNRVHVLGRVATNDNASRSDCKNSLMQMTLSGLKYIFLIFLVSVGSIILGEKPLENIAVGEE